MIRHIVMFRLKDAAYAAEAKEKADKLPSVIPQIRAMEVRLNAPSADQSNYHIALICDFDSQADLDAYQVHPEHKQFGAYIATIREEGGRACIDYEI